MDETTNSPETDEIDLILRRIAPDPCFAKPAASGLVYPEKWQDASLLIHLAYAVTRQPNNLHCHVRRIRAAAALALPEALAEAMTDLFIVLGDKGRDLREGMLKDWGERLPAEHLARLERALPAAIEANEPLPVHARLTKGHAGRSGFVVRSEAEQDGIPAGKQNVPAFLDTIRDLIDSGHLDEACTLLENELSRAETALWQEGAPELARLYRYVAGGEARARAWWAVLWRQHRERARDWAELLGQGLV